jgi:hypothetical protein
MDVSRSKRLGGDADAAPILEPPEGGYLSPTAKGAPVELLSGHHIQLPRHRRLPPIQVPGLLPIWEGADRKCCLSTAVQYPVWDSTFLNALTYLRPLPRQTQHDATLVRMVSREGNSRGIPP